MSASDRDRWHRAGALFRELVELAPERQSARLREIGSTDPELQKAVERLLAGDAVADERLARIDHALPRRPPAPGPPVPADPLGLEGETISHFRVAEPLGAGGMGVVYRAFDLRLHRTVALKFPLPQGEVDEAVKRRFLREAQAAGAIDHPNLCTVYEVGESPAGVFLAMPLYPGETLRARLDREGVLPIEAALDLTRRVAAGLAAAHAAGIVHRDIKPGNLMLLPDGTVKVLDFGVAKVPRLGHSTSKVALGTIGYMAPEQIRGASTDTRSDLWSLGVILYEMVTGVRPFLRDHDVAVVHAILQEEVQPPGRIRPDLPDSVEQLISSLLQKQPARRYQSAGQLLEDLAAVGRGEPPAFRPPPARRHATPGRLAAWSAAALTVAAVVAYPELAASRKPTRNAEAYRFYLSGQAYEERGPLVAAESLYRRALALDSGFALARARLAILYAGCRRGGSRDCYGGRRLEERPVDRLEQIRTEAQAALALQPGLAEAHFAMGLYWEQREEPARALDEYALARKGLRPHGALHAAIGRAHRARGEWEAAFDAFERALRLDPNDPASAFDLATTYSRLRRYEESVRIWDRYLALVPDAYPGMIIRGNVYLRWHGTIDTLAAVVDRMPPDERRRNWNTRVLLARIRDRPAEALAALDEAPLEDPEASITQGGTYDTRPLLRAHVYADMGDFPRARAWYDTARMYLERRTRLRPRDFSAQVGLGLAYAGLGRTEDARKAADSAMAIMPPSRTVPAGTTAMRGAAEILARLPGHEAEAIDLLDRLMQMPAGREASVPLLRIDPAWRPLRADPRFQQLLTRYSGR